MEGPGESAESGMARFENILVVGADDSAALARAARLARSFHARLTFVEVVQPPSKRWRHVSLGGTRIDLQDVLLQDAHRRLEQAAASMAAEGLGIKTKVLVGTPFLEVIRDVIRHGHDLVMMAAERGGGIKQRLLGSTSMHLVRKCPCPVWIMKPSRRNRLDRVMAAVDPDPDDLVRDGLNARILDVAAGVAAEQGAELHVVHVCTLMGESALRSRAGISDVDISALVRKEAKRSRGLLRDLIDRVPTAQQAKVHVVKGLPGVALPRFAQRQKVDLLVMGTVCRTGISGLLIGNTAESVMGEAPCSVLTVKPEGFVSPVVGE